jgi:hypothetical protein
MLQRFECLTQGEFDAFEGGAQEVAARVVEAEAGPGASGARVEARRPLSAQLSKERAAS